MTSRRLLMCGLAVLLLAGCGAADDAGGASCALQAGNCPNACSFGIGVVGETCAGDVLSDCQCGLYCKAGVCAPYDQPAYEGCSCDIGAVQTADVLSDDDAAPGTGSGDAATDTADAFDATRSFYTMKVSLPDGTVIDIDRDLTDLRATTFSFGSAHISPAVAFAVTDTITWPQSVTITLDFGKVVGSAAFPIQTDGVGEYLFSAQPPAVEVYVELIQYKSLFDGAEGHVTLTDWGQNTGDIIAGSYAGKLIQDTALEDKLSIDVEGVFHFVLPVKHAGQPG